MQREGTTPPLRAHVPKGMSHVEYVLRETEQAFLDDRRNDAIVNLCHAVHVLASEGEPLPDSVFWFRRLTHAARAWE